MVLRKAIVLARLAWRKDPLGPDRTFHDFRSPINDFYLVKKRQSVKFSGSEIGKGPVRLGRTPIAIVGKDQEKPSIRRNSW